MTDMMSGVTGVQPPSQTPEASADATVHEPATGQAETEHEHPPPPPPEAPRMVGPESFPGSAAGMHLHMHLDLDFTLPGMSSFAVPFSPDAFDQFAMPMPIPTDGPTQRDTMEQEQEQEQDQGPGPPPPAHAVWPTNFARDGLLPAQGDPLQAPPPSQPRRDTDTLATGSATSAETAVVSFGTGLGQSQIPVFGLEAVGTHSSESMPAQPPGAVQAAPLSWGYLPPSLSHAHEHLATAEGPDPPVAGQRATDMSEFMIMDDTLTMWPGMSQIFG